jgi:hypothetical protein
VPSVVYRMNATPDSESAAERLTLTDAVYQPLEQIPPLQAIEDVGDVVSTGVAETLINCEFVASTVPALSHARYFIVAVDEMLNVPV